VLLWFYKFFNEICLFSDAENVDGDFYASQVESLSRYSFCVIKSVIVP